MPLWEYNFPMPRAPTTTDVFNAIAEHRRRRVIDVLVRGGPCPVGQLVRTLRMSQPTVSKHLAVLRKVGLVRAHRRGRQRFYALHAPALDPVRTWIQSFDRFWEDQLDAIKQAAERKAQSLAAHPTPGASHREKP